MAEAKTDINTYLKYMACAGISGSITECIALPADTIKARLMLDTTKGIPFIKACRGAFNELLNEGYRSFFKGLTPGIHRQLVFASVRIGLYDPVFLKIFLTILK